MNIFLDENDGCFLPLFTDWPSIRKWTEQQVDTIVMSAIGAWEFIKEQPQVYQGAVINPGDLGWALSRAHIQNLIEDYQKM